jgi:multimeric flavodoxin WrbA
LVNIVGISGTHRSGGNTTVLVDIALEAAKELGANIAFIELCELDLIPCKHCSDCGELGKCVQDDDLNRIVETMLTADAIILGAPVHFGSVPAPMKNMIDRAGRFADFAGKVGAALVVSRRSGIDMTLSQLHFFLLVKEMIIPGTPSWPIGFALNPGDVRADTEAIAAARDLGYRVAVLTQTLKRIPLPWTNGIPITENSKKFGDEWK